MVLPHELSLNRTNVTVWDQKLQQLQNKECFRLLLPGSISKLRNESFMTSRRGVTGSPRYLFSDKHLKISSVSHVGVISMRCRNRQLSRELQILKSCFLNLNCDAVIRFWILKSLTDPTPIKTLMCWLPVFLKWLDYFHKKVLSQNYQYFYFHYKDR